MSASRSDAPSAFKRSNSAAAMPQLRLDVDHAEQPVQRA